MGKNKSLSLGACMLRIGVVLFAVALIYSSKVIAASFSQGYRSRSKLVVGAVVSTLVNDSTTIEKTTLENEELMVGVVSGSSGAIIDLQPKGSNLRVGISGEVSVLVTDLDGQIKTGDYLVVSPIAGIATKDTPSSPSKKYIATAKQDFDVSANNVKQIDIQGGSNKKVHVGTINAELLLHDKAEQIDEQNYVRYS